MSSADSLPEAGGGASPPRARFRVGLLFLLLLALAMALRAPGFSNRVFNSDEAYVATQAQALRHGERLYVDTVDRKPPVVPLIYAAVFDISGSDDLGPVRVVAAMALALTALLLSVEARRRYAWKYAPLAAGVLFLLAATALRPLDAQAANFEFFALPISTAAVLLAIRGRSVASGLALALAVLTLQAAGVVVVPIAWLVFHQRRARGLAALAVSAVAPIIVAAFAFGWSPFVRWMFTSNDAYLAWRGGLTAAAHLALSQTGWFLLGSLALVALLALAWPRRRDDRDLWLWLAAAAVPVVAGLRFFGHYYLELLPPLALVGVRGLSSPWALARRWLAPAVAFVAITSTAAFLWPAFTDGTTRDTRIALAVGSYFAAHTRPDQRVLVWGQAPEAYWRSDRRPAVRFATTGFLTGASGGRDPSEVGPGEAVAGAWHDFLADLHDHPPALIADMSTADQRHAAQTPPSRYPQFAHYLERGRWRRVATVDGVAILAAAPA